MDKVEGGFEGLSDRSHRLPLAVGMDDLLIQVKRVLLAVQEQGALVWSLSLSAQALTPHVCSDLKFVIYFWVTFVLGMN